LIENSIQDCLSYIQIPNGSYRLFLAYPKWPCICLKVNMCITCYMTLSLPEYFISFYVSHDLWLSLCHLMWLMWDWVVSLLTLTLSSKNRKMKINKNKNKNKNKKKLSSLLVILTNTTVENIWYYNSRTQY